MLWAESRLRRDEGNLFHLPVRALRSGGAPLATDTVEFAYVFWRVHMTSIAGGGTEQAPAGSSVQGIRWARILDEQSCWRLLLFADPGLCCGRYDV